MKKSPEKLIEILKEGNLSEEEMRNLIEEMKEAGMSGQIMAIEDPDSPEAKAATEYVEYHKELSSPIVLEEEMEEASRKLLSKKSTLEEKKKAIILLAHTGKEKPLKVLKKYGDSPDEELKVWINMAIDECKSFLASNILGEPIIGITPVTKVGRNDPCPCGSGKKYKKCCGR